MIYKGAYSSASFKLSKNSLPEVTTKNETFNVNGSQGRQKNKQTNKFEVTKRTRTNKRKSSIL